MGSEMTVAEAPVQTIQPYKFTVADYNRMGEVGIFHEDDRVELIHGEIVCMTPIGPRHSNTVTNLTEAFAGLMVAKRARVSVQNPVVIGEHSKPQPDVVLLRPGSRQSYSGREYEPRDVLLTIEVADSSLPYDRLVKLALYAEAGIPEVWIVDLTQDRIEVYRNPSAESYDSKQTFGPGQTLAPSAFSDLNLKVEDLIDISDAPE
jgi:Uma2 family endonuclease